ncbi:hypothetical protein BH11PSE11_BH11PSE11_19750 [soil metagenome]
MKNSVSLYSAAILAVTAASYAQAENSITQNQSGWGNSQSISIGNSDGKPAPKSAKAKADAKKLSSTQKDDKTGNTQSVNVDGGSGNIAQNQSGRNNSQSINIGGNTSSKLPTVTQTQTGADRKQSVKIDGKKVETESK